MSVVAFTNHRIGNRIQEPRSLTTVSFVEIAGILPKERRQYGASDIRACNKVSVGGAVPLSITLRALSISAEIVLRLLNSGNSPGHPEGDGIHGGLPGKLELLLCAKRDCIMVVTDVEIWNHAEHALL